MKAHFTYNFVEKAIIGSKAAINRANKGMNPEYTELKKMLAEYRSGKNHPEEQRQEDLPQSHV